jgi:opacity protein-like surface antigen
MKISILAAVAAVALAPTAAFAADSEGLYAGIQGGYHDFDGPLSGGIVGGYFGYNAPAGGNLVFGVEGNANLGTGDIDAEYGASVHIGGKFGANNLLFARAGYQEVNFDVDVPGVDDSDGDYLVGVGADFGVNEASSFRIVADTIAFDSMRLTAGWSFNF